MIVMVAFVGTTMPAVAHAGMSHEGDAVVALCGAACRVLWGLRARNPRLPD